MFKKTERQLIMISVALVVVTAGAAWLFASHTPAWGVLAALVGTVLLAELWQGYKRLNKSVVFLLEALEHGDYSLRFAENTRAKRDANSTLNAIKEILIRARESEIKHERFLSLVMAAIPTGIVIIDERDFVRVANSAALRLLGMPYLTHVRQLDAGLVRALEELTPRQRATVRVANERDERLVSLGVSRVTSPMGEMRVVTMQNIADELQEREMESWTKLIRVMTHEIMNSIAPITSLAETMLATWEGMTLASNSLRRDTVDAFAAITATARDLMVFVESYRRFAGVAKPSLERVTLVPLIENAVRLAGSAITSKISDSSRAAVTVDIIASDPDIAVPADRGQIGQVLLNLLKNAAEAGATRIEVRVSRGAFAEGNSPLYPDLPSAPADGDASMSDAEMQGSGGTVLVEVSDNGTPIPDDVLPHIFVPFFTTKAEGTGVGLSISRHIMRLHGGNLTHSTHNGRTLFELTFK